MKEEEATHGDILQGLGAIEADVRWIRESLEHGSDQFQAHDKRLKSLERSRTSVHSVAGFLAVVASAVGLERLHDWLSG